MGSSMDQVKGKNRGGTGAGAGSNGHADTIVFEFLADLKAKPVKWEVPGRFPRGKVTLVAGDGGMGKSTLVRHLIACLTTGRPAFGMDYAAADPGDVVMFAMEDGYEDVVVPHLIAEGADLTRVFRVPYVERSDNKGNKSRVHFGLEHLDGLKVELGRWPNVRLVVIDPIASFVGRCRIDDRNTGELRRALDPLTELAEQTGVAIIVIAHINKAEGVKAVYRIAGSHQYTAAVRLAYLIGEDPDDAQRRFLMPVKKNLLGVEKAAVAVRLEQLGPDAAATYREHPALHKLSDTDFTAIATQMARLAFDAPVAADADRVMGGKGTDGDGRREKRQKCIAWLVEVLADFAFPSEEIFVAGKAAGFSDDLVYASRKEFNGSKPDPEQIWAVKKNDWDGRHWWGFNSPINWTQRPPTNPKQQKKPK